MSRFTNDVRVDREEQNVWKTDETFTSQHDLNESIFAAYTSINTKIGKKTTAKAGLRYEYTNSNLNSDTRKNIVDRHYGRLFPSIYLSYALTDKNSFNLSANRRITRPTFNDMAPFVYFVDPNTVFSGNPALQPSFANQIKADYLIKQFVFSISFTHETNSITNFSPTVDPVTNKQTLSAENQKSKDVANLTMTLPVTVNKWWAMQNNLSGYWQQLNAVYKNSPLLLIQKNISVNTTQTVTLPKDYTMELTGFYQSGGLFGIYKMNAITSLNFGLRKKLGENGGTLLFNVTDFSGPPKYIFSVDAPEQNLIVTARLRFSVTTFKLTYTRKFGNAKVKESRQRETGAEDEKNRMQTN